MGAAVKVWIVEENWGFEPGEIIGVCATSELADELRARQQIPGNYGVRDEDVLTELPPAEPVKPAYQVIP